MVKKKKYQAPKRDTKELQEFREHIKTINEKSKVISEKYKMWWDSDAKTWKKGFEGHGNS
jgi:hypothetical protein|tara:strand:+ start:355 stop:534 length:180 start_codon:yes stop_codon:yes gene_type:complete